MTRFHLAHVNIGRFVAPIDDPVREGFRAQPDPINALADASPGFVWRLQAEASNAATIRPFGGDDRMAINMSVTISFEALQRYVYQSAHVGPLRDRRRWFDSIEGPILALWWIPAGHIPTVAEGLDRLVHLKEHGPTRHSLTFRAPFPAPNAKSSDAAGFDARFCEWATQRTAHSVISLDGSRMVPETTSPLRIRSSLQARPQNAFHHADPARVTRCPNIRVSERNAARARGSTLH